MYERLIAFFLGRKSELGEEELQEFMELLCSALGVSEEYRTLEKHAVVENMVDSANIKDRAERAVVSSAIEKILQFSSEGEEELGEDILADRSDETPLRNRKVRRGSFARMSAGDAGSSSRSRCKEQSIVPSQIFLGLEERTGSAGLHSAEDPARFEFVIGDLEENHCEGPGFAFNLDE